MSAVQTLAGPAVQLPTPLRLALWRNGYRPVPVVTAEKRPGIKDWTNVCADAEPDQIRQWAVDLPRCQSTGLLCGVATQAGSLIAVDIDVPNEGLAHEIEALAVDRLGPTPLRRVGRAPKLLLCHRTPEPLRKMQTPELVLADETRCRIEILGHGQQFVAYGTHPDTKQPYRWTDHGPARVPLSELPCIDEATIAAFIKDAEAVIRQAGGAGAIAQTDPTAVVIQNPNPSRTKPDAAVVAEALDYIPADLPYDDWVKVGLALYAWDGGDIGRRLWCDFSAKSTKNQPTLTDEKWPTFDGVRTLDVGYIVRLARQHGWLGSPRPLVRIRPDELPANVDEAEAALIAAGLDLYQHGGRIVRPTEMQIAVASGAKIVAARLMEVRAPLVAEQMMRAADFEKFDGRRSAGDEWKRTGCPRDIAETYLARGTWCLPVLTGIVHCPTLRPDGSVLDQPGYDPSTGLLYDPRDVAFRQGPAQPTREQARTALGMLTELIHTFPFVSDADRAVALSGIITAVIRPALETAPLHAFTAPAAGSGKSMLVDLAGMIATGRPVAVIAQGKTEEEMEKRLGAILIEGATIASIDNCEAPLGGELLCQMLTQQTLKVRILGRSATAEVPTNCTVFATGNNLRVTGDMTRRTLMCALDPQTERPELRRFDFDPLSAVQAFRDAFAPLTLTIVRAYIVAGYPGEPEPLGSFARWSRLVRGPLLWLGEADPCATMDRVRATDAKLEATAALFAHWHMVAGDRRVTAAGLIDIANQAAPANPAVGGIIPNTLAQPDLREALKVVAGEGAVISARRLGALLAKYEGRIVNGLKLGRDGAHAGTAYWRVQRA